MGNKLNQQPCILCGTNATFSMVDRDDKKYFKCKQCGKYLLYIFAEAVTADQSKEWKDKAIEEISSLPEDEVLLIELVDLAKLLPGEQKYPVLASWPRSRCR